MDKTDKALYAVINGGVLVVTIGLLVLIYKIGVLKGAGILV